VAKTFDSVNLAYALGSLKPEADVVLIWDEVEWTLPECDLAALAQRLGFTTPAGLHMATTPVLVTVGDKQVLLLYQPDQSVWFAAMDEEEE